MKNKLPWPSPLQCWMGLEAQTVSTQARIYPLCDCMVFEQSKKNSFFLNSQVQLKCSTSYNKPAPDSCRVGFQLDPCGFVGSSSPA